MVRSFLSCMVLLAACQGATVEERQSRLMGTDDSRRDVYAHPDPWLRDLARQSVAAMIPTASLDQTDPSNIKLLEPPAKLGVRKSLCPDQRFFDDPTVAHCTAFLISPDLVLTNLHCSTVSCGTGSLAYSFVFNYLRDDDSGALHNLTSDDVFSCGNVVASAYDGDADWAIVRLDRAATPRFQPAPLHRGPKTALFGHQIAMIGAPTGIPLKIADGALVDWDGLGTSRSSIFTLIGSDMLGGNSGSPLIDLSDYTVVGLLSGGPTDPEYVPNGSCNVVNTVSDTDAWAFANYLNTPLDAFCAGVLPPKPAFCDDGVVPGDDPTSAYPIAISEGREQILSGSTLLANASMTPPCGGAGSPDVFYKFTLTTSSLVYADSFTSDFDTVLFLTRSTSGSTPGYACSDDACGYYQSQLVQRLDPGTYYLSVGGYNGAKGRYVVHLQATAAGASAGTLPSWGSGSVSGNTSASLDIVHPICGGTSRDNTWYSVSCPGAQKAWLNFSTCGGASWDTVVAYHNGNMPTWSCNDDSWGCGVQSSEWVTATSGPGLRLLTVDGYSSSAGSYTLNYSMPNIQIHASDTYTTPTRGLLGGTAFSSSCPSGSLMVGLDSKAGPLPTTLTLLCAWMQPDGSLSPAFPLPAVVGGSEGTSFHDQCPIGQTVVGLLGSTDSQQPRSLGIVCAPEFEWLGGTGSSRRLARGTTISSGVFTDLCYSGQSIMGLSGTLAGGGFGQISATCVNVY